MFKKIALSTYIILFATVCFAQFAGGSGTVNDPYLVETTQHLNNVRNYLDAHFIQIADIDISSEDWLPIGVDYNNYFSGSYDGDNYVIEGLRIRRESQDYNGLFGYAEDATLKNIKLDNAIVAGKDYVGALVGSISEGNIVNCSVNSPFVEINGINHYMNSKIDGRNWVGGLVGTSGETKISESYAEFEHVKGNYYVGGLIGSCGDTNIKDSYVKPSDDEYLSEEWHVKGTGDGSVIGAYYGGLVGATWSSIAKNSYSTVNVSAENYATGHSGAVGGLIGSNQYYSKVESCYSSGNIIETGSGIDHAGGLIGNNDQYSEIIDSYAMGNVVGDFFIGGLVGTNSNSSLIENSFSAGEVDDQAPYPGGLIGYEASSCVTINSYWDIESSGMTVSASGEGRSTAEMTYPYAANTYVNWDFNNVWDEDVNYSINDGYPFLQWQTETTFRIKIYTNIDLEEEAQVVLSHPSGPSFMTEPILKKGWNDIDFEDIVISITDPQDWESEATASGVAGETYIKTGGNFLYDEDTDRWVTYIRFTFDNKHFHNNYNWVSFPRLDRIDNNPVEAISEVLTAIYPTYTALEMEFDIENSVSYEYGSGWNPNTHDLHSSDGVIIHIEPALEEGRIYEVDFQNDTRLCSSTSIDLIAGENYVGYWVPKSQKIDTAFGDHWDKVEWIKAEDWYYRVMDDPRNQSQPVPSERIRSLHYGEGYIVKLSEPINGFQWVDYESYDPDVPIIRSRHFEVEKDFDYEAVDVFDIPDDVIEIGVFQNRACVGAVVVQEPNEQILVYSQPGIPLSFEFVTERGSRSTVNQYGIYDPSSGRYRYGQLSGGMFQHSMVSFKEGERFVEDESTAAAVLHPNYPNPANPETTFSFTLAHKQDVELTVYNIRGQKVRTVYEGSTDEGAHSIVWNGKDSKGRVVSSGVYFYKLKTESAELTEKLILLK
jgi:hypothetical protein